MVGALCNRQTGLTLIETAVVLLIIGLLAVAASPLTSSWRTNADLHTAGGQLNQAYSQAKAVALRNAAGATGNEAAARIAFDPGARELKVCASSIGPCTDALWRVTLPPGVELALAGGGELSHRAEQPRATDHALYGKPVQAR